MLSSRFALTASCIAAAALLGACSTNRTVAYGVPAASTTTVAVPAVTTAPAVTTVPAITAVPVTPNVVVVPQ
jgi:hypothetical protein